MAEGKNLCMFIGHCGADPKLSWTQSGEAVLNFRLACGERYKDREGNLQEKVEWVPFVVWGKRAEGLSKYITKGTRLSVDGKFTTRKWTDKNGVNHYSSEIRVREVLFLSSQGKQVESPPETVEETAEGNYSTEDIPF